MPRYRTIYFDAKLREHDHEDFGRLDKAVEMCDAYKKYRKLTAYVVDNETGEIIHGI